MCRCDAYRLVELRRRCSVSTDAVQELTREGEALQSVVVCVSDKELVVEPRKAVRVAKLASATALAPKRHTHLLEKLCVIRDDAVVVAIGDN